MKKSFRSGIKIISKIIAKMVFNGADIHSFEARYRRLYGEIGYSDRMLKDIKTLKYMCVFTLVIFSAAFILFTVSEHNGAKMISTSSEGNITSVKRPSNGQGIFIDANVLIKKGGRVYETKERIKIVPQGRSLKLNSNYTIPENISEQEILKREVNSKVRTINSGSSGAKVVFPRFLDDGAELIWMTDNNNSSLLIIPGCALCMIIILQTCFSRLKREEKEARDSVLRSMPGFINKMVLLLNAGIVLNDAFARAIPDRSGGQPRVSDYFYDRLSSVKLIAEETNRPFNTEFAAFAKRSEVKELMRFSNIINENINKGSDLISKLEREAEMLWFERKKNSEEKGRIAETKLTIPLMILLLVLITVTVAPALIEM